jgi:hypothetical protein
MWSRDQFSLVLGNRGKGFSAGMRLVLSLCRPTRQRMAGIGIAKTSTE